MNVGAVTDALNKCEASVREAVKQDERKDFQKRLDNFKEFNNYYEED